MNECSDQRREVTFSFSVAGTETLVIGTAGNNVTLTCQNASQRALVVEWFRGDPDTTPILFSSDGKLPDDSRFSLTGNASLHIAGLRLQDESNYTCKEVLNETDHSHRVQLLVASKSALVSCFALRPGRPPRRLSCCLCSRTSG